MSCEHAPNRFTKLAGRISGGIAQLAGKRGFYAGLALGVAGLAGAGLVAAARRRSRGNRSNNQPQQGRQTPALIHTQQVLQLGERDKARPIALPISGERCASCRTPAGSKPGAWYNVNGRPYCPDCASDAAGKAGIDLVASKTPEFATTLPAANSQSADRTTAAGTPVATIARSQPQYLPVERRVQTRLTQSRVGVYTGQDQQGQPAGFAVNGYVIMRSNGDDTGLALTPALKMSGQGEVTEDINRWWVTHIPSGKHIPGAGPYERPEEGELLASLLAQMDWTRDEGELSTDEIRQVGATVTAYNTALAEQKQRPAEGSAVDRTSSRRVPAGESLEGKLVADGYGGVARVLEDSGQRLYVIDSLGERYEVHRSQVRTPDEADFEGVRVAMSFDPAQSPPAKCALCGRPTSGTGAGEMWYKMNFKTFCEGCAGQYAAQEGYGKEDEI